MSRITKLEDKNGVVHTLGDAQVSSYEREISGSGNVVPYSEAVKKYVDSEVAGVESSIESHIEDTDNPHEVTASQVGAYSKTESDETFETKADAKAKANAYGILMRENGTNTLQFYRPSLG